MPILPYQKILYESLQNHKHIWVKNARGIDVAEFLLGYIPWGYFSKYTANSRACIVTGPRLDLAEDLIDRFKGLFSQKFSQTDKTASTVASLNGVKVEAFRSHHVVTMRGLITSSS